MVENKKQKTMPKSPTFPVFVTLTENAIVGSAVAAVATGWAAHSVVKVVNERLHPKGQSGGDLRNR